MLVVEIVRNRDVASRRDEFFHILVARATNGVREGPAEVGAILFERLNGPVDFVRIVVTQAFVPVFKLRCRVQGARCRVTAPGNE